MARQFVRPAPGNKYTAAERAEWGRQQDIARAARNAPAYQKTPVPAKRASRSKVMVADQASSCFDALVYQDGTVTAFFTDGSVYEYEMSRADARDWFSDQSLGSYFNALVR